MKRGDIVNFGPVHVAEVVHVHQSGRCDIRWKTGRSCGSIFYGVHPVNLHPRPVVDRLADIVAEEADAGAARVLGITKA